MSWREIVTRHAVRKENRRMVMAKKTGECPQAPAIRSAVKNGLKRVGRFLTSNKRKKK